MIRLQQVGKTYYRGKEAVVVLKGLDLEIAEGAFEALMGPSGSGKSTLLNLIAGLDGPTQGTIEISGVDLGRMSEAQRAKWRSVNVGFVFQAYNLLPVLIVADEPTGDLDRNSTDQILELLVKLNQELHKTILMVTHDPAAASHTGAVRRLNKGSFS